MHPQVSTQPYQAHRRRLQLLRVSNKYQPNTENSSKIPEGKIPVPIDSPVSHQLCLAIVPSAPGRLQFPKVSKEVPAQ